MSVEFLDYVEDILAEIEKTEILLEGVTPEQFESDFRINYAVIRALEIIGEATKRLPLTLRTRYPSIPWRKMAGLRDRLTHGYDSVDMQIVWDVAKRDIPDLRPQLQQILADFADSDTDQQDS